MSILNAGTVQAKQDEMINAALTAAFNFFIAREWDGSKSEALVNELDLVGFVCGELKCTSTYVYDHNILSEERIATVCDLVLTGWSYQYVETGLYPEDRFHKFSTITNSEVVPVNSWLYLVSIGSVSIDTIDEYIDRWHDSESDLGDFEGTLPEFLGMSRADYLLYLEDPDNLKFIVGNCKKNLILE